MKKILFALSLSIICASCNQSAPNAGLGSPSADEQTQPADWEITAKVKEAILINENLAPSNRLVSVSTTDGVVTLTGNVSSQDDIDELVKTAGSIFGVKRVNNQMTLSS